MPDDKTLVIYYTNPVVCPYLGRKEFRDFVTKKIGVADWQFFSNELGGIHSQFDTPEVDIASYFNGICTQQLTDVKAGGTFINPMFFGLCYDYDRWKAIMVEEELINCVVPLDISYEDYESMFVGDEADPVPYTREEFTEQWKGTEETIKDLSGAISTSFH